MNIKNKSAHYEYFILKEYIAGIQLVGSEVKSIAANNASIKEAYIYISKNEVFIKGMHIAKYNESSYMNHDEIRDRKLLLKKKEIAELIKETKDVGLTIIPMEIFPSNGKFKLKIAISKGKKLFDKRSSLKEKDAKREVRENS